MNDLAKYEALLADWRAKEETAATMRAFRDAGGQHRLRVSVIMADPAQAAIAAPVFNEAMSKKGWASLVDLGVKRAEREAEYAKASLRTYAAFEGEAL